MKLIRQHQPQSRDELVDLIRTHAEHVCPCGIRSQGSVDDFGRRLYEAQIAYWGEYRYALSECVQWQYDLFVIQSLKGNLLEQKALEQFRATLPHLQFNEATHYLDQELRIDLIIRRDATDLGGVQVKPLTFVRMRESVVNFNAAANQRWGKPVLYLYYNQDGTFNNFDAICQAIDSLSAESV